MKREEIKKKLYNQAPLRYKMKVKFQKKFFMKKEESDILRDEGYSLKRF